MSFAILPRPLHDAFMDKNSPLLPHSVSPWSKTEVAKFFHGALTDQIIGAAIEVHKQLGPGFLESIYEEAFSLELSRRQIPFDRQAPVPVHYSGVRVGMHRIDLIVDRKVVVEIKAVKEIEDAHLATCLSYLKATKLRVGLIINFSREKTRIRRVMRAPQGTTEKGNEGVREEFFGDPGAGPQPLCQAARHESDHSDVNETFS